MVRRRSSAAAAARASSATRRRRAPHNAVWRGAGLIVVLTSQSASLSAAGIAFSGASAPTSTTTTTMSSVSPRRAPLFLAASHRACAARAGASRLTSLKAALPESSSQRPSDAIMTRARLPTTHARTSGTHNASGVSASPRTRLIIRPPGQSLRGCLAAAPTSSDLPSLWRPTLAPAFCSLICSAGLRSRRWSCEMSMAFAGSDPT
mmetsp:Transcript_28554/g.96149  ORF Transcript_28554/g.96149 Transcript_28554/m.96149 type:complete len:206 (-) Transcript_28554:606-1223(-)